jgi:uncharacterized membrane protein
MADAPPVTMYHRLVGWHAPAMRRLAIAASIGMAAGLLLLVVAPWPLALILGWDSCGIIFLAAVWPIILRADSARTQAGAMREDETRGGTAVLLVGASVASLIAVGFPLALAGKEHGGAKVGLIGVSMVTVVLSWIVVNTVFTLRYADLYFLSSAGAIDFGEPQGQDAPNYRDFAYVAFTIGMTYQVSDTTLRDRTIRRTVLFQAVLSYLFGVGIVAAGINLVAGLVQ